jgi:uncharacterized protein YecE (DUF72 family)
MELATKTGAMLSCELLRNKYLVSRLGVRVQRERGLGGMHPGKGMAAIADIHIGTSGWHYNHWRGRFYPEKFPAAKMLDFYAQHFGTVEINNSFYRLPPENAVKAWRDSTPRSFHFAIKGSRYLTHMKKLNDPEQGIARFMERADLLGAKLGPILFQLPPGWELNLPRLEEFLEALPPRHHHAFELRNETWRTEQVYRILRRHKAAFCIYELAGYHSEFTLTANFAYVRLHGPGGAYAGSYDDDRLSKWADRIREWRHDLRAIYVYFDNDQAAHAVENARRLDGMVDRARE